MQTPAADPLAAILCPERLTSVVDIGANPLDGAPPYKAMLDRGLCSVVGFEPQAPALAQLNQRKGPRERYLPYAVGDGRERTLYICNAPGMTSLYEPDPERLALFYGFPTLGRVDHKISVATHRLDDIADIETVDFLKIDVQGSELDVFRSGREKLSRAVVVQTEVSFIPLYREEPAIGEIDTELRRMGFLPHSFAEMKSWPLAPAIAGTYPGKGRWQPMLEADLVYVRDFTRAANMDGEQWKHLALIAHHCYGSADLVMRALAMAAGIGAIASDAPARYVASLQAAGM